MPIECLISFDNNPQGVYYAGQELSGVVDLRVDATKRIKAIHITVSGYAKIRWIKKGYPRDSERATCRAYRSYLSSRSYVLGTCATSSAIDWSAGEYSYTFHVILPESLPTSFDGKYGQIHYEIITTIDRPGRYSKVFKLPFTVIHPLDLNADAIYRVPLEILNRKRFWSFCCPTGPLTVKFSTPYCGYAPGQKIHFVLYINNESSIDITACDVKLKQEVAYESHDPQHEYRYDKNLIARKQFGNVLRWSRKVYRGYLDLPSIPPTSAKTPCPIVVNYSIKIVVNPTEFHWKMKLKIPLTIGSIPIMDPLGPLTETRHDQQHRSQYHPSHPHSHHHPHHQHPPHHHQLQAPRHSSDQSDVRSLPNEAHLSNGNDNNHRHPRHQHQHQHQHHHHHRNQHHHNHHSASTPALTSASDADNPPDYIPMMPPSYEEAMALSEKFFDDTEYSQNVSMSSIASNGSGNDHGFGFGFGIGMGSGKDKGKGEPYKPRYPVYYEYETPTIPPESLYDESPLQLRIALEPESTSADADAEAEAEGDEDCQSVSSVATLTILRRHPEKR